MITILLSKMTVLIEWGYGTQPSRLIKKEGQLNIKIMSSNISLYFIKILFRH